MTNGNSFNEQIEMMATIGGLLLTGGVEEMPELVGDLFKFKSSGDGNEGDGTIEL